MCKYDPIVTFTINLRREPFQGKVVFLPLGYLHIFPLVSNLFYSQSFSHGTLNTLYPHILFLSTNLPFNHICCLPTTCLNFLAPFLYQNN